MPLPDNAKLSPFGKFRHIRWGADIILLDLCSRSFGWAMNINVPLIYIDNLSCWMTDRAAEAVRQSVFYISSMEDGWKEDLRTHLKLSHRTRISKWMAMADPRQKFSADFVNGGDMTLSDGLLDRSEDISELEKM